MSAGQEVKDRIEALPSEHRKMLADAIDVLSQCFGEDGGKALMVFVPAESIIAQMFVFNANEMDAYDMSAFVKAHMDAIVRANMPEKEMLN